MNNLDLVRPKFITDENVGKLTRLLRIIGLDTVFFTGENDTQLVNLALAENRIILTRDTHIMKRKIIIGGKVKAILIESDNVERQIIQVMKFLSLEKFIQPFTICLEDNHLLISRTRKEIKDRVPPYVWQTQKEYVECPFCHRIYWKGTHWEAMTRKLEEIITTRRGI
jgi:uncharacterized protein